MIKVEYTLLLLNLILSTIGQFNSPNDLCGGIFHRVRGSIHLNLTEKVLHPPMYNGSKVCIWQISPSVQWSSFRVSVVNWTLPNSKSKNCDKNSLSISSFKDRDSISLFRYGPFCSKFQNYQIIKVEGMMMVIVLRMDMDKNNLGSYIHLEYDRHEDAVTNHKYRFTTMNYSWGFNKILDDPTGTEELPYFTDTIIENQLATYAISKGNESDHKKISLDIFEVQFDQSGCSNKEICDESDYFAIYSIERNGLLKYPPLDILRESKGYSGPYESLYGLFLLWNAANNSVLNGGGTFSMNYRMLRLRTEL